MKPVPVSSGLLYAGVVLLFAVCGACSAAFLSSSGYSTFPDQIPPMLPIPFALLCALLFMRSWRAIVAVPLMVAVWVIAFMAAGSVGMLSHDVLAPGCVGGLIGGVGLVLCAATCHRRLLSPMYVFGGAVIGSLSALEFVPWVSLYYSHLGRPDDPRGDLELPLMLAFAIWQVAVGAYLYKIARDSDEEAQPRDSAGLTIVRLN